MLYLLICPGLEASIKKEGKEERWENEREAGQQTYELLRVGFLFTEQIPCDSTAIFLRSLQIQPK